MKPRVVVILVVLLAGIAYGFGMFDSDETRIRNLFGGLVGSFNDTHLGGCLEGFAEDYRDATESTVVDRDRLKMALRGTFLRMVDPKTKAFLLRLRLPDEAMSIDIADPADKATVVCTLYLERSRAGGWQSEWQVRVTAQLKKVEGEWHIHESKHETTAGARPK